jgi:hypothetical protein
MEVNMMHQPVEESVCRVKLNDRPGHPCVISNDEVLDLTIDIRLFLHIICGLIKYLNLFYRILLENLLTCNCYYLYTSLKVLKNPMYCSKNDNFEQFAVQLLKKSL